MREKFFVLNCVIDSVLPFSSPICTFYTCRVPSFYVVICCNPDCVALGISAGIKKAEIRDISGVSASYSRLSKSLSYKVMRNDCCFQDVEPVLSSDRCGGEEQKSASYNRKALEINCRAAECLGLKIIVVNNDLRSESRKLSSWHFFAFPRVTVFASISVCVGRLALFVASICKSLRFAKNDYFAALEVL